MKNSFIYDQAIKLQNEYCAFLKNALIKLNSSDFLMILDEINLFWYSNREIVQLILNYISYDSECYTFTGASFLDINDKEHFPFVVLGEIHIVDDPLHKFISVPYEFHNAEYAEKLRKQIMYTIEDNIKIIEEYSSTILIFPVTLLTDINLDVIVDASNQAFFSMFKDESMTYERYFNELNSIADVVEALDEKTLNSIIFTEKDDVENTLEERFNNYLHEHNPFSNDVNEARIFYFTLSGFFSQSFNILLKCTQYNMIPYLRYDVVFRYLMLLGTNFMNNEKIQEILFKSACAHLLYKIFDKNMIKNIDFMKFVSCVQQIGLTEQINSKIDKNVLSIKNYSINDITDILKSELNEIYECVSETNTTS
ncbi:MAG: hypothetical protein MJA82_14995 [Clostridia bacterium]|nr:hypothetical protein [Clostridia bacterium]